MSTISDPRLQAEREYNAEIGREERLPPLLKAIATCRAAGDHSYRLALQHWIDCVKRRISTRRPYTLKIPDVLRMVLGLASQNVILEEGDFLWSAVDGGKVTLLYSPHGS
jgi:hypothetical protein